jgi:hypothetical protein
MVSIDLRDVVLLRNLVTPEYIDVSATLSAGQTVTLTYTVPAGYVWFKIDVRYGPTANRVFKVSSWVDDTQEISDMDFGHAWAMESWRCIKGSVAYQKVVIKVTNQDIVSHDLDMLMESFIVPHNCLNDVVNGLTQVSLSDDSIEKLANKIAEKLQPIKTIVPKIE